MSSKTQLQHNLKKNQLALKTGLEKINETNERLADIKELPDLEDDWVPMPPPDDGKGWDSNWVPVPRPSGNQKKTLLVVNLFFYKIMIIQDQMNLMKLVLKIQNKYIQT